MKFFVIYSVDVPFGVWQGYIRKPEPKRHWRQTEGRESYEYAYLEGDWAKGNHRKWCALLTRQQFETFLKDKVLYPETTETMGSISEYGWQPAISFDGSDNDVIANAYVTPIPEIRGEEVTNASDRDWERVRQAVISYYENWA